MFENHKKYTFDSFVRILVYSGISVATILLLKYLSPVLMPFAMAMLLAYLLNPIVNVFEKWFKKRGIAVWLTIILIIMVILSFVNLIAPRISKEFRETSAIVTEIIKDKTTYEVNAESNFSKYILQITTNFLDKPEWIIKMEDLKPVINNLGYKIFPKIWEILSGTANLLVGLTVIFLILIYLLFILFDYELLKNQVKSMIPLEYRDKIIDMGRNFEKAMNQYFRAQMMVAFSVGILFSIGFSLINLPLGIALGIFVGFLNLVPYMQVIGYFPALLLAFVSTIKTGVPYWHNFLLVNLVFVVVQSIQELFLMPTIMREMTGLRPAVVVLSLTIWGKILGFFGLIIAIPFTCILLAYYQKLINNEMVVKK